MPTTTCIRNAGWIVARDARVVRNGRILTLDHTAALGALTEVQQRMLSGVRQRDHNGRTADEVIPLSLPTPAQ